MNQPQLYLLVKWRIFLVLSVAYVKKVSLLFTLRIGSMKYRKLPITSLLFEMGIWKHLVLAAVLVPVVAVGADEPTLAPAEPTEELLGGLERTYAWIRDEYVKR